MYCPDVLPSTNKFTINKATFEGFGGNTVTVSFEGDAEIPDDATTDIDYITTDDTNNTKTVKRLKDGHIVIESNGVTYNVAGLRIEQ